MKHPRIDLDHPRFPVWDCPELLARAAAVRHPLQASNEAVHILAGDPPEAKSQTNYHSVFLGPQCLLHDRAGAFVDQLRDQFDFSKDSSWFYHRGGIAGLIRSYFPEGAQALGTLSITPMRRPAPYHSVADPRTEVTSLNPPGVVFLPSKLERRWEPKIWFGERGKTRFCLPVRDLDFAPAVDSRDVDNRWVKLVVTRCVRARHFRLPPGQEFYQETWLCRGRLGKDQGRLMQGHIPAVPRNRYQDNALRVRLSPILTLGKIDLPAGFQGGLYSAFLNPAYIAAPSYQFLAVEIDKTSGGRILSVRHGCMPLSVFLLNAMPVEHIGICQLLRSLVS